MTQYSKPNLDDIDHAILRELQRDSSVTNVELSEKIGLSPTPCLRRVKRLEAEGYIVGYRADVDRAKLGYPILAFVEITLNTQIESALEIVEQSVLTRPEVINCYLVTGDCDYMLHVVVQDLDAYAEFMRNHLTKITAIRNIKSSFALEKIVEGRPLPRG